MDISKLTIDSKAMADGRWVTVGGAYGDLKIFSRGFTDEFYDAQTAKLEDASLKYGGAIPNAERRRINAELLQEFLVMDVGNCQIAGVVVPVIEFHAMLFKPNYVKLAKACWDCAARVSSMTEEQLKSAEGNFGGASGSTSQTQATASE